MLDILTKNAVGLDISDFTIEAAELTKSGGKVKVSSLGRIRLRPGIVERGRIKDSEKLARAVRKVLQEANPHSLSPRRVTFGLPESLTYTQVAQIKPGSQTKFKKMSATEKDNFVRQQALKFVPLEDSEMALGYRVRLVEKDRISILLSAANKRDVREWQHFFQSIKIDAVFDIETLATSRALFNKPLDTGVCIIDIGSLTSTIMIIDKIGLRHAYQVSMAGRSLTKVIQNNLKNTFEEAEKIKIQTGIADENSDIFLILIKKLENLTQEIKTVIKYYRRTTGQGVAEVVLVGGSSRLKGLTDYLEQNLGLPVGLGFAWLAKGKASAPSQRFLYIEAIGLALREIDKKWDLQDPAIDIGKLTEDQISKKTSKHELGIPGRPVVKPTVATVGGIESRNKLKKQKLILLAIVFVTVVALVLAFIYRNQQRAKQEAERRAVQEAAQAELIETMPVGEVMEEEPVVAEEEVEPVEVIKEVVMIIISETPTGWLNVREGPGLNYPILTKVNPGEKFELLEEDNAWYSIQLNPTTTAWITSKYATEE